jgi:hypothetical protein
VFKNANRLDALPSFDPRLTRPEKQTGTKAGERRAESARLIQSHMFVLPCAVWQRVAASLIVGVSLDSLLCV